MVKRIPLGEFALVDDEDEALVAGYTWFKHSAGYAIAHDPQLYDPQSPSKGLVLMHRKILGLAPGDRIQVDHINRDKLDNRRKNLRIAVQKSNALNHSGNKRSDTDVLQSPYKGVHWLRERQRWSAQFRGQYLGMFDTDLDGAIAYDAAARASGDRHAHLNFPRGVPTNASSQGCVRRGKGRSNSTSKYRGVSYNGQKKKWATQINVRGVKTCWFTDDEELAARWYDVISASLLGKRALLNFPDEPLVLLPQKQAAKLAKILERIK